MLIHRQDFSAGWQPSADLINGPKTGFPRGDNLVLGDQGVLRVRRDMECISGATPLVSNGSVHSLFTISIESLRYRYAGIDNTVWRSDSVGIYNQILSNFDGTGDINFGANLGMVMAARGTTKFKNNPITNSSYRWGVDPAPNAPALTPLDPDEKTFSSFNDAESPPWIALEGIISAAPGFDDSPNGARSVTPSVTTGKGTIRKIYPAEQDFTAYDGGEQGVDEDNLEFYAWIQQPSNLEYITLSVDVNGSSNSDSARFRDDYYYVSVTTDQVVEMKLDPEQALDDRFDIEGFDRQSYEFRRARRQQQVGARIRQDTSLSAGSGWAKFSIPRGKFIRVGSTPGKNWSTVKALQLEFKTAVGEDIIPGACRFDRMKIIGGRHRALTGKYKVAVQMVAQFDKYEAKSPLSPISEEIELRSNGLRVGINLPASYDDGQVTGGVVFLFGGTMDGFYEAARRSFRIGPGPNNFNIDVESSDADLLIQNIRLDPSIQRPPDNIIGIAGPFDSRMMALTENAVYPSLVQDLDAYSSEQVLTLPGKTDTGFWITGVATVPFVGTSRDILQITGDGSILPDGTINYGFRDMHVPPPISRAFAQEGNLLIYLAADGWRIFNGTTSTPLVANLDLLYQGYTRYGISPPNLGSAPGRFRAGIFNHRMFSLIPEGASDQSSNILHVHNLATQQWEARYVLPRSIQSVLREPDGKILVGDSSGSIYQLEAGSGQGDLIPSGGVLTRLKKAVTFWTFSDDNGDPITPRLIEDFRMNAETGADVLTVELLANENTSLGSVFVQDNVCDASFNDVDVEYQRIRAKMTGSFADLVIRSFSINYVTNPPLRARWDSGPLEFGVQDLVWISRIRIYAKLRAAVEMRLTFDGNETDAVVDFFTAASYPAEEIFEIKLPLETFGGTPRIQLRWPPAASLLRDSAFELTWVEIWWRGTGRQTIEKKVIKLTQDKL